MLSYEHKLKRRKDTIKDLERVASYFRGKNYFDEDGTQNYLVFKEYTNILKMLMFQKLLLNFMLIHGYQKDYLMKKLVLLVGLNVHL